MSPCTWLTLIGLIEQAATAAHFVKFYNLVQKGRCTSTYINILYMCNTVKCSYTDSFEGNGLILTVIKDISCYTLANIQFKTLVKIC